VPSLADTDKNAGKDLVACAVCVNAGKQSTIIACINWGFYIDANGKAGFDPKPPVPSTAPPRQVKVALDRFEKIAGNGKANIQF
jgi:hypothetical protein